MSKVFVCVSALKPLLAAMVADEQEKVATLYEEIAAHEHDADDMKKELRHHLPKGGLFMPMDRRDLLEVLLMQDNIANRAKDVAGLVVGRKMTVPAPMQDLILEYGDRCVEATEKALAVVNELDELVETGFRGREVERVEAMLRELDDAERETDRIQIQLRAALFKLEDDLRATDVMFIYRLIEWLGNVADFSQKVGSRLQLLLAR